jgi:hypothetical protein
MDSDSNNKSAIPFTQLPKEIRLLVWEATFEPQYILLRFVEGRQPSSNIPVYAFKPYDDPKTPIALQVCSESRRIALQRYRPWNFRWYLHDRVERSKMVCIFGAFPSVLESRTSSWILMLDPFRISRMCRNLQTLSLPMSLKFRDNSDTVPSE